MPMYALRDKNTKEMIDKIKIDEAPEDLIPIMLLVTKRAYCEAHKIDCEKVEIVEEE